ncbi:unnamed protein product, partial [Acanthoscelides obtectus]
DLEACLKATAQLPGNGNENGNGNERKVQLHIIQYIHAQQTETATVTGTKTEELAKIQLSRSVAFSEPIRMLRTRTCALQY